VKYPRLSSVNPVEGARRPYSPAEREDLDMRMNFGEVLDIEDLGSHPPGTVIRLGILLAGAVNVMPDPKRKNFYEVRDGLSCYYIYVSPVTATISLIAAWRNTTPLMPQLHFCAAAAHS
jgi:hypothetical protein